MSPRLSVLVGRPGDCLGQVLILLAGRAAHGGDLDQLGLGKVELALLGIGFAEIFVGVDVARIEGERLPIIGETLVIVAELARGIADHRQGHRIGRLDCVERRQRFVVAGGKGEIAALLVKVLVVEAGAVLDALMLGRVINRAVLAAGRASATSATTASATTARAEGSRRADREAKGNQTHPGEELSIPYLCHE
jgi:hypothetical protein